LLYSRLQDDFLSTLLSTALRLFLLPGLRSRRYGERCRGHGSWNGRLLLLP
jgi:hypothetical protein